ncbi:albumin-binding GA domain-containing protein [Streptococcus penaeicida]
MKDKKLMKYYLRKSACGLASVSAAFIIGGASVAADDTASQVTSAAQSQGATNSGKESEIVSKASLENGSSMDKKETSQILSKKEKEEVKAKEAAKLEEAGKLEKVKGVKSHVSYTFANQQDFNLPESLGHLVTLPKAFDAQAGDLIKLPKIDTTIKTLAGEWHFKGWMRVTKDENLDLSDIGDEFEAPADGEAINLVGNWEFVPYAEAGKASEEKTDSATGVDPENSASQEQDADLEPDQAKEEVDDKAKELEDAQKEAEEALKNYGASSFYLKRIKKAKTVEGVKELMRQLLPSLKENVKKEATKDLAKYLESEKTVDEILAKMPKAKAEEESKAEEAGKVKEDVKDVKTPELPEQKEADQQALPENKAKEDHKGQGQGLGAKGAQSMPSAPSSKAVKGHILPSTGEKDMHNLLLASAASIVAASTMLTYGSIKKKKEN